MTVELLSKVGLPTAIFEINEIVNEGSIGREMTVKLDRDSRKYIHVRINNVIKTYDNEGSLNVTNQYYDIIECTEEHMWEGWEL